MRYIMLIYINEAEAAKVPQDAQMAELKEYFAFTDETREKGLYEAGEPLESVATATTVRLRNGERLTTDGPFAETKEQLGGFYILDCEDLDQAIEYAAKIPAVRHGSIEVRPIMTLPPKEAVS